MAVSDRTDFEARLIAGLWIVVSQQGATTRIALDGEWDLAQREKMRYAVRTALARHPDRVVLDLSRVTFMDSSGIHGFLELARRAARVNVDLVVIPGPRAVQRLFELSQLSESITFADDA